MASIFQTTPTNLEFINPTGNEVARIAGSPTYCAEEFTLDLCYEIGECGFNAIAGPMSVSSIENSLRNCEDAALKMFFYNANLLVDNLRIPLVNQYKDFPALGGWLLNYDPGFPGFTDYDRLLTSYNDIIETDPNHPAYIALPAEWEGKTIGSFPDYVAKFQTDFKPSFWPYSYFPDIFTAGSNYHSEQRLLTFFKNLQYFAYISRYTARPFWVYCRCQAFQEIEGFEGLPPSESIMRGVIFSSLAYGAQGIYYWNYKHTYGNKYYDAPIDENDNKTSTWYMVQRLNQEIMAFDHVFYNCEVIECRHSFQPALRADWIKKFENPIGPLMSVYHNSMSAPGILISHIFKDGKDYLVIVANPYLPSHHYINLYFSDYYKVYRDKGFNTESLIEDYNYSTPINPGDYLIFRWE